MRAPAARLKRRRTADPACQAHRRPVTERDEVEPRIVTSWRCPEPRSISPPRSATRSRHGRASAPSSTAQIFQPKYSRTGPLLATSLFGDVAAALREHGSATLDEHCCYFRRPDCVMVGGHRDLRSRGITHCPVTTITVTHCDGRDSTDLRYPPSGLEQPLRSGLFEARRTVSSVTLFTL